MDPTKMSATKNVRSTMKESEVPRIARLFAVMFVVVGWGQIAVAEDSTPSVTIMSAGANEFLKDIEYIIGLTSKQEQKQWPVLEDYFGYFLGGIDRSKPIRIDLLLGGKAVQYRSSFPLTSFSKFRDNLDSFGIDARRSRKFKGLYQLKGAFVGWMKYNKFRYAVLAETRAHLPRTAKDPRKEIARLLDKEFDIAVDIRNSADGQAQRKKSFQNTRDEILAAVKRKKGESKEDFALRKMFAIHQMNEAERFFVEARQVTLGWTTDVARHEARLDIELDPIADTQLESAILLLGQNPSHFANIEKTDNSILSGRINHPLDAMRKNHLLDMWSKLRAKIDSSVDGSKKSTAKEKANRKQVAGLFFDMLVAVTKTGTVDGFVEVDEHKSGKHTIVAGMKVADGNKLTEIIELLEGANLGEEVEVGFAREGDVSIHKVVLPARLRENFKELLGENDTLFLGTSQKTVWLAAGDNGLEALTAAIEKGDQPAKGKPSTRFIDFYAKVGPWLKLRDQLKKAAGPKPKPKKTAAKKSNSENAVADLTADRDALRKLALQAFALGDDTIHFHLDRVDNRVEGQLLIKPGILRFAGKLLAKFSKENFDED